jgi:hypothetical protein
MQITLALSWSIVKRNYYLHRHGYVREEMESFAICFMSRYVLSMWA